MRATCNISFYVLIFLGIIVMNEKQREERFTLEPSDLISAEFEIGIGPEMRKFFFNVINYSRQGLGLLVTKADFDLLRILKRGDRINNISLYTEWAVVNVNASVSHITKIKHGLYRGNCILGVESDEIIDIFEQ